MKITTHIARALLGFVFLVFGLDGFLHFIPMPPPSGVAGQFLGALFVSNFLIVVFLLQIIPAILLLLNRYVPLALTLLGPVLANRALPCVHGAQRIGVAGDPRSAVGRRVLPAPRCFRRDLPRTGGG